MAAGLTFLIKGDSSGFVSSVKKAEKAIGGLTDRIGGATFGKLSNGLKSAAKQMEAFQRTGGQRLKVAKEVDKLNRSLDNLSRRKKNIELNLKSAKALAKFKDLQDKMRVLQSKPTTVKVLADQKDLITKLKSTKTRLRTLQSQGAKVNLRLNTKQALSNIKRLDTQLKRVKEQTVRVKFAGGDSLKKYNADLRVLKIKAAAIKLTGLSKLKGKAVFDRIAAGASRAGLAVVGKMVPALYMAAKASQFLATNLSKMKKVLAFISVGSIRLLAGAAKASRVALAGVVGVLKRVGSGLKSLTGSANRAFAALQSITLRALQAGAVAAGAAVAGLVVAIKSAVSSASNLETMGVAFTAITGSAKGSADLVAHLREESLRTGVEIGSMATMVRRLMANGMDVTEAKKMTSSLLDISGTLGLGTEEAKLLGIAISQVQAKGVVSMEELRQQIAEKGVPVFDVLAQKLDVTKGKLMEMVANGEVSSDVLMDAFSNLEGPLAKFRGGADKLALTWQGSFNRMKAAMTNLFADAGAPLLDGLSAGVSLITRKLTEWGPKIKEFAESAGGFVRAMAKAFSSGKMGQLLKLSLVAAAKEFVNRMFAGLKTAVSFTTMAIVEGFKSGFTKITDMNFWVGVSEIFKSAWTMLKAVGLEIVAAMPGSGDAQRRAADSAYSLSRAQFDFGMRKMAKAGDGKSIGDIMNTALEAALGEYQEAVDNPLLSNAEELERIKKIYGQMIKLAEADKKAREAAMSKISKDETFNNPKKVISTQVLTKPVVSSLQSIGGGRIKGVQINLDQKRNVLLNAIDQKLARWTGAVYV